MLNKITLFMFCFACTLFQAKAQFSVDEDSLRAEGFAGATVDDYIDLSGHTKIKNKKNTPDTFVWVRTENALQSSTWTSAVCDINQCWGTDIGTAEFILKANDSGELSFHFYPKNVCGNGKMVVRIARKSNIADFLEIDVLAKAWCLNSNVNALNINNLAITPNPASNKFVINSDIIKNGVLSLYNMQGQLINQTNYMAGNDFNTSNLSAGVYFISYTNGINIAKSKVVIQ